MPALDYTTAKKAIRAILQASRSSGGYASTVDSSKDQFSSDTELDNAILYADAEVCNIIINTPGHPFQYNFTATSSALQNGATLPLHTGMVLKVTCLNGQSTVTLTGVTNATNIFTVSGGHGLEQGQKIQIASSGSLPSGLSAATDYWVIYVTSTTFKLAANPYDAGVGTAIDIATDGTGTITVTPQYIEGMQGKSADEVREMYAFGNVYKHDLDANNSMLPFWFIEGDVLYTSALYAKVLYTTFTLTSSPQAPEAYMNAVVAGSVASLLKDGGDDQMAGYYRNIYDRDLEMIRQGVRAVPAITAYKMQNAA